MLEEKLLNIEELCKYLGGIKKSTVYDWVYHKRIPYVKLGRCLRFKKDLLDAWIEKKLQLPSNFMYNKIEVGSEEAI